MAAATYRFQWQGVSIPDVDDHLDPSVAASIVSVSGAPVVSIQVSDASAQQDLTDFMAAQGWVPATESVATLATIIFRPGGVADGNVVTDWPSVQDAIAAAGGAITIFIDSSLAAAHVPAATGTTDFQGAATLVPYNWSINPVSGVDADVLTIDDGAVLHRVRAIQGPLTVQCACVTTQALSFSYGAFPGSALDVFYIQDGAQLGLLAGATVGAIQIPAGSGLLMFAQSGITFQSAAAGVPLIDMLGAGFFALLARDVITFSGDVLRGGATAQFNFTHDDSIARPSILAGQSFALFTGTLNESRVSLAQWAQPSNFTSTDPNLPMPPNVQQGQLNYASDLGQLQVWDGAAWRNVALPTAPYSNPSTPGPIPTAPAVVVLSSFAAAIPAGGGAVAVNFAAVDVTKDATAGDITFMFRIDGATSDTSVISFAANENKSYARPFKTPSLPAGTHTIDIAAQCDFGTATLIQAPMLGLITT